MNFDYKFQNSVCYINLTDEAGTNTIDEPFCESLREFVESTQWDPTILVWVFTSGTNQVFSTGRQLLPANPNNSLASMHSAIHALQISQMVSNIPVPVIMGIDGRVSDHGLELALSGDIRLVSDISTFSLNATEYNFPWDNGIPMLVNAVGRTTANDMLYTNRVLEAVDSLEVGLATRIVSHEDFESELDQMVTKLSLSSPASLKYVKEAVKSGLSLHLHQALAMEGDLSVLLQSTADRAEGLKAFFEKRTPKFRGD